MLMTLESYLHNLTPKQRQAIPLIACGKTGKEVADAINVNPATVSLWLNHNRDFNRALQTFAAESSRLAQIQLNSLTLLAIKELSNLLQNAKSEQIRLKAVEMVLGTVIGHSKGNREPVGAGMGGQVSTNAEHYDFDSLVNSISGGMK